MSSFRLGVIAIGLSSSVFAQVATEAAPANTASLSVAISSARTVDAQTADLQQQRERLMLENQVRDETLRKTLSEATGELQRLRLESDLARAKAESELSERRIAIDRARMEAEELNAKLSLESTRRQTALQSELAELR
ncbi:MAG: hypothetical protein V4710_02785, partial [Verrucomicrobiota bacterium]